MKKVFLQFILLILTVQISVGQDECTLAIRGKVVHEENNEPIESAYVWIKEVERGGLSDFNGNFRIQNLCAGTYTLTIQYLGHKELTQEIDLYSSSNFTFRLEAEDITLQGVDIHGHQDAVLTTTSISSIRGDVLRGARGESLGESLRRISGVSTFSTGSSISKPVIHGLHSNRIMILNNGVRLEGQQWGTEHAPEIDPFTASEIAVIKGAETVRFGPEAMGGVILVNPDPLPIKGMRSGEIDLIGFSNGRGINGAAKFIGGSNKIPGLGYRLQASSKFAGNVQSPDYFQDNTGIREYNFSGAIGYSSPRLGTELYISHFQTEIGILRDAHTGNLSDLESIIENGRPFREPDFTYQIANPRQAVNHQLLKIKSHYHLKGGSQLNFQYGFQRNDRKEYDRRRGSLNDRPSLDLELFTNTLDFNLAHKKGKNFNGTIGLNFIQQANSNIPGTGVTPLIPNYDMANAAMYAIQKYTRGPLEIEGGVRYDYRSVKAARIIRGTLEKQSFTFNNFSAFIGGVYAISRTLTFNTNFGTAWRPPNINEQFSQGLHHGVAAIEIGNPEFVSEQSFKWVNTIAFTESDFNFELTAYANRINNYIFLTPTNQQVSSLRGTFNVFEYLQTDANLWGIDLSGNYEFSRGVEGYARGSLVRAKNLLEDNFIPFIPSDRLESGLRFKTFQKSKSPSSFFLSNTMVARQNREPEFDLAPAPAAYMLWNAGFQTTFKMAENRLNLGLSVTNLFDTAYKEYMNRFRYFTHEMGRNIMLKLNYEF